MFDVDKQLDRLPISLQELKRWEIREKCQYLLRENQFGRDNPTEYHNVCSDDVQDKHGQRKVRVEYNKALPPFSFGVTMFLLHSAA